MRFGVHVGIGQGFARAIDEAEAARCECVQIFAGNPRAFKLGAYDPEGWEKFRLLRTERGVHPVVIHTSYLINLATPNGDLHRKSEALLAHDLRVAARAGIEYVNTHLGSYGGGDRARGFARVCATIKRVIEHAPPGPMLLLENSAGAGNLCGGTLEELGAILKEVGSKRVGVCIDTAHAWASGYDLHSEAGVAKFGRALGRKVGFRRVRAIHLNDTKVELGAKRDRHWHVGHGRIGMAGFRRILAIPGLAQAAVICETPKTAELDRRNVATARRLAGMKPFPLRPAQSGAARGGTRRSADRGHGREHSGRPSGRKRT